MSRPHLQDLLNKVEKLTLEGKAGKRNRDQILRKDGSNKVSHETRVIAGDLALEARSFVEKKLNVKVTTEQQAKINAKCSEVARNIYNMFPQGATRTQRTSITGTPDNFVILVERLEKGQTRLFEEVVRKGLKSHLGELESFLSNLFNGDESWSREFGSSSSNVFHLGHEKGFEITNTGITFVLSAAQKRLIRETETEEVITTIEKFGLLRSSPELIRISLENSAANQNSSGKGEGGLKAQLDEILAYLKTIPVEKIKGSPSMEEEALKMLEMAAAGKKYTAKFSSKASKTRKSVVRKTKSTLALDGKSSGQTTTRDWTSMLPIINSRLADVIISKMAPPRLQNRTGAFAHSAQVTGVEMTAQGFPSFIMSYDKTPYGVFDRRTGAAPWATPARDPYTIIEESIREILSKQAIGRFYLRRS